MQWFMSRHLAAQRERAEPAERRGSRSPPRGKSGCGKSGGAKPSGGKQTGGKGHGKRETVAREMTTWYKGQQLQQPARAAVEVSAHMLFVAGVCQTQRSQLEGLNL